jgi:hypothetical protein
MKKKRDNMRGIIGEDLNSKNMISYEVSVQKSHIYMHLLT